MSQDTERLYCCCGAAGSVCADPDGRLPLSHVDYIADCARQPEFQLLAREVQASRKLVAAARILSEAIEAEMIRLAGMAYPDGDFQCPADPCPYCTAQDEFTIALMEYEGDQ